MNKYIIGAVLSIGLLVSPAFTEAAGLTSAQVQAILSLLSSFGADQSVINNVQVSLTGSAPTTGDQFCYNFRNDLTVGSRGADVSALNQAILSSGVDTTGNDSNFTENDAADVVLFQAKYGIRQTGYVGPITRAKLNALYGCSNQSINQSSQSVQQQIAAARAKGNDAAIQSDLSTVQTMAEIYYVAANNSYTGICSSNPTVVKALNGAQAANGNTVPTCNYSATAYAASSPLSSDNTKYWCVDSTGFAGYMATSLGTNTACSTQSTPCNPQSPVAGCVINNPAPTTLSAPTVTFTGLPSTIAAGQFAILVLSSSNASSCFVSNQNTGSNISWLTNDHANVSPDQTTTYIATCTGAGGSTSQSVTITVPISTVASGLTSAQIQSLTALLFSFGASNAAIQNVTAVLGGGPAVAVASSGLTSAQTQSILNLLSSWGATSTTIANIGTVLGSVTVPILTATTNSLSGQSATAGSLGVKIGSFTVSSNQATTLQTINIAPTNPYTNPFSSIKNLRLYAFGVQIGTAIPVPTSSNAFTVNLNSAIGGSVVIDVYADILNSASGSIQSTMTIWAVGTSDRTGPSASASATVNVVAFLSSNLTPAAPQITSATTLSVSKSDTQNHTVTWGAVSGTGAYTYKMQIDSLSPQDIGNTTSWGFNVAAGLPTSLSTVGTHTINVEACNTNTYACSGWSNTVTVTVTPAPAGALSVSRGSSDPASTNILAGASQTLVGQFNFTAQNASYTVKKFSIGVTSGTANSIASVMVQYKDVNGTTQTATVPLTIYSAGAMANFSNLSMYVPANSSANLNVYIGTPTIAYGATSGAAIRVSIDGSTVSAVSDSGTGVNYVNSNMSVPATGTFYVRKSVPTFAMVNTGNTIPSTGTPLYKFSVTVDPSGAIEWSKVTFSLAASGVNVSNLYLVDDATGSTLTDGNVTPSASVAIIDLTANSANPKYQQVAAGATKTYDLYGTVSGFTTGSYITISLASDNYSVTNASAASVLGNIVWSDRSAMPHSVTSSDWTNSYLLHNFTSNAVSYSK